MDFLQGSRCVPYGLQAPGISRTWRTGHAPPLLDELTQLGSVLTARDEVVAEGHTGPLWWDGEDAALPEGIDAAIVQIFAHVGAGQPVNTLCALAAESPREDRARGLAEQLLQAMRVIGVRQGLTHLVAPVRPSLKERYPLTAIERYVRWRREDGQLFDPWMRVHERLGARVATSLPRSLRITGTVRRVGDVDRDGVP